MNPVILIILFILMLAGLSCHNRQNKTHLIDSDKNNLPYNEYWKVLNDSLKFTLKNNKNDILLDTLKDFKIIKGHFTSMDKDELILERTFRSRRGSTFDAACLFAFEDSKWEFKRFICKDSIAYVDIDQDGTYELFITDILVGFGCTEINTKIISFKNNISKILFENESSDCHFSTGAFTISKSGDTIVNIAKYEFIEKDKNKPFKLKETKKIGIKKGISKNKEKLVIEYSIVENVYTLKNEKYK